MAANACSCLLTTRFLSHSQDRVFDPTPVRAPFRVDLCTAYRDKEKAKSAGASWYLSCDARFHETPEKVDQISPQLHTLSPLARTQGRSEENLVCPERP